MARAGPLFWRMLATAAIAASVLAVPSLRTTAVGALRGERFVRGRPTSEWARRLNKAGPEEAAEAADALARIGAEAVPRLVATFERDRDARGDEAAKALAAIGPAAGAAVPVLVAAIRDGAAGRREQLAGSALVAIGPASTPALTELLTARDAGLRAAAAWKLGELGPAAEAAVPDLLNVLRSERGAEFGFLEAVPAVRTALARIGRPAVPGLLALMGGNAPVLRAWSIGILGEMGGAGEAAADALLGTALRKDDPLALLAAESLARIAPAKAAQVITVLVAGLGVRVELEPLSASADALARIGGPAVEALAETCRSGSSEQRQDAARALVRIGPAASAALPAVLPLLGDPNRAARLAAFEAFGSLGRDGAEAMSEGVAKLVAALGERDDEVVAEAARALERLGPAAAAATVTLARLVARSECGEVRLACVRALGSVHRAGTDDDALPALYAALREEPLRVAAAEALWRAAPNQEPLFRLLRDRVHRRAALDALERLALEGRDAAELSAALAGALDEVESDAGRLLLARAIVALDPGSAALALPALCRAVAASGRWSESGRVLVGLLARVDPAAASALTPDGYDERLLLAGASSALFFLWAPAVLPGRRRSLPPPAPPAATPAGVAARGAFTLLELLVSSGILVVIGMILVGLLKGGLDLWHRAESNRDLHDRAGVVFEFLAADLACATLDRDDWPPVQPYDAAPLETTPRALASQAGQPGRAGFFCSRDAHGRSVLRFTRVSAATEQAGSGGGAAAASGEATPSGRAASRDAKREALALSALNAGLRKHVEVFYALDPEPEAARFYRAVLPGPVSSDTPFEPELLQSRRFFEESAALLARGILDVRYSFWAPGTTTWRTEVPPPQSLTAKRTEAGPETRWDSTRWLDREFALHLRTLARIPPTEDLLPVRVRVSVTVEVDPGRGAEARLDEALPAEAGETLVLGSTRDLPDAPDELRIDDEWVRYSEKGERSLQVEARGARGTRVVAHEAGARVRFGRTFQVTVSVPAGRGGEPGR
ncbi:MAG: HEAT repeat domain-containing protein [Planctomycetes bacterium]|nr:HEAT repeat domain-containing protein [Planctomycetota bacterium]